ncbi:MAG: hypothetical protein K0R52_648 [Alphaproteobacteria bacterium]|jgi:predicted nuclease of restriction endonuclease-like (RecB) superfamily|nr:hypothetical protein [Alphaproteobacteria bacterium]
MTNLINNQEYLNVLNTLKAEIKNAQLRAHLSVNRELVILYWRIGREILDRQKKLGWGGKIIDQLLRDLKHEFPDMKGFSPANLHNMRRFAGIYLDKKFLQQVAGELPWYHHVVLTDMVFYHTHLRCYVVIELKVGKFQPSYIGQLEFYQTVFDRAIKHESDHPTIGLLLCQEANHIVVEYALSKKQQPLGVSRYWTTRHDLPKEFEKSLPTPEQFQHLFETIKDTNSHEAA